LAAALTSALLLLLSHRSRAESESSPSGGKVTVTVFFDYQGPFDQRAMGMLAQIERERPADVRFVFKNFPLPMHKDAPLAAKAVIAAGQQGKSRKMQEKLFANQTALKRADIEGYAREIGLDAAHFARDLDGGAAADQLNADLAAGRQIGVRGTPTVLVDNRKLDFATYETLNSAITQIRAKGKAVAADAAFERPGALDPPIARDVERAKEHVSTIVMGVPLGEKLKLPKCSEANSGEKAESSKNFWTGSSRTCIPDGDRNAMVWGGESLPGWVDVPYKPTVEDRVLLGATFLVTETDQLAKDLSKKYGTPTHKHEVKLQNSFGATSTSIEMEWRFPGLVVHYTPTTASSNGSSIHGKLEIKLETLDKRERAEKQKSEDAGPHL
jgi:hypothetical protein